MAGTLAPDGKVAVLRSYAERYPGRAFVETGLYQGRGSGEHLADLCSPLIALDMQERNCADARPRYTAVLEGDSGERLPEALELLDAPAIFWLDAHLVDEYDGRQERMCPLLDELAAIRAWPHGYASVVLIDDYRLFGSPGLPSVAEVEAAASGWAWALADDIVRLEPV
jgi:hypothetical protein